MNIAFDEMMVACETTMNETYSAVDWEVKRKKPWTAMGIFGRLVAAGLAAILLLVGLCAFVPAAYFCVCGMSTKSWPSVPGTIVRAEVEETVEDSGTDYDVDICYEFAVDGISYQGDSIGYGWTMSDEREPVAEKVAPYAAGKSVLVHYDPDDPSQCVLETGMYDPVATTILAGFAGICGFFGVPLAWLAFRGRDYIEPQPDPVTPAPVVAPAYALAGTAAAEPQASEAVDDYWAGREDPYGTGGAQQAESESGGMFDLEKQGLDKGVLGGLAMMGIAVVWFVGGWACGYIFFYPPILFVIGLVGLVKGMFTGNVNGQQAIYQ